MPRAVKWSGRPRRAALRAVADYSGPGGPAMAEMVAAHLGSVWNAIRPVFGMVLGTGDIEHAARLARHIRGCDICNTEAGEHLLRYVLPTTGLSRELSLVINERKRLTS